VLLALLFCFACNSPNKSLPPDPPAPTPTEIEARRLENLKGSINTTFVEWDKRSKESQDSEVDITIWGYGRTGSGWEAELAKKMKKNIRWGLSKKEPDLTDMIKIPAGDALIGHPDEGPVQRVRLGTYYVDKFHVTIEKYNQCVKGKQCFPLMPHESCPVDKPKVYPAVVTYKQALRYCLWAGKQLPTDEHWVRAACGDDGRKYPWGNQPPSADRANVCGTKCMMDNAEMDWEDGYGFVNPIGLFPNGDSPFGLNQPTGNVREWVRTSVKLPPHHYIAAGASWYSPSHELTCTYRHVYQPLVRNDDKGFRCIVPLDKK
jgi:formylglycine-generating enzyme required for sulfatase activity